MPRQAEYCATIGIIFLSSTSTPKVCKIMAFMAVIMGLGPLFCILLGLGIYYASKIRQKAGSSCRMLQ